MPDLTGLRELQKETQEWRDRNFPGEDAAHQALGVCEEAGEIAHAVLKMDQGIRGDKEKHLLDLEDGIGDLIIFAMGLATNYNLNIDECLQETWNRVKERDWKRNPVDGS